MNLVRSLLFFAMGIAVASGGLAQTAKKTCQDHSGVVIAVLVDVSEPLSQPQQLVYERLVTKILNDTPGNARFDLYRIASSVSGVEAPLISLCKPAPKFESSLLKGDKFWEKKLDREFYGPITSEMLRLGRHSNLAQFSPVIESLFSMSLRSFTSGAGGGTVRGKVYVISDFLQHSPLLSFYTTHPPYRAWRSSVDGRSWVRRFKDVEVEAMVIPRSGKSSLPLSARDFFREYFQDNFAKESWRDISAALD